MVVSTELLLESVVYNSIRPYKFRLVLVQLLVMFRTVALNINWIADFKGYYKVQLEDNMQFTITK